MNNQAIDKQLEVVSERARNVYVVYILRSVSEPNHFYCGMTNNIRRRLRQHNGIIVGGGKYTSANRPWKLAALIYAKEKALTKGEALHIEYYSKAKNYTRTVPYCNNSVKKRAWLILEAKKTASKPCRLRVFDDELKEYVDTLKDL